MVDCFEYKAASTLKQRLQFNHLSQQQLRFVPYIMYCGALKILVFIRNNEKTTFNCDKHIREEL